MPTSNFFEFLPDELICHIGAKLDTSSKASFSTTQRRHRIIFRQELEDEKNATPLLRYVTKGKQNEAQTLIKENPNILTIRLTFTDPAGRTFKCNAFEYAFWAKDIHMCRMFLKCTAENEELKAKILSYAQSVEENGLTYSHNDEVIHDSKHFDLAPLLDALEVYTNGYNSWLAVRDKALVINAWLNVGKAQRLLPTHFLNEICRQDIMLCMRTSFDEETLPRELGVTNGLTEECFELLPFPDALGRDYAITMTSTAKPKAEQSHFSEGSDFLWDGNGNGTGFIGQDLSLMKRLDEVRTTQVSQLVQELAPKSEPRLGS